ncbi:fibrinogen-like 2a isoform X3 [Narcine bancroftii]|uniref:fibrinogen-like 2a isoform X3 n=1 Tax=Narcine bancroftii TaxID=1343680 RepID=UPI003831A9F1
MMVITAFFLLKIGLILCVEIPDVYNRTCRFKNPTERKVNPDCSIKLKPQDCDKGVFCGYQINLPPLTLDLPKETKLLEKTVKTVGSLTATVNKMKKRWLEEHKKKPNNHAQTIANIKFGKHNKKIIALEKKVKVLTTSLRIARNQINLLQDRLEERSLLNMDTVLHYIKTELSNINYTVNTLNNTCYTTCAAIGPTTDLDISTFREGCVKIKKMECDNCSVETERGHSILNSLKAHKVKVQSRGGNVICLGTIHGNVDIQTSNKGVVEIEKLQGTNMNISTTNGALKTKYIYAKSSHLSSSIGNIELGNIHDSSDGNLKATTQQGDLDVYISQLGIVNLITQEGSITLKVPKALRAKLQLSGAVVEISPELYLQDIDSRTGEGHQTIQGFLNGKAEGAHLIEAHTVHGMLNIKSQSWIESLKLNPL